MAPPNFPREEIARLRLIDSTADRFEAAWRVGAQPRIEDFLVECSTDIRGGLLAELLTLELEWRSRHKLALSPDDYLRRFPYDSAVVSSVLVEWRRDAIENDAIAAAQPTATHASEAEQSTIATNRLDESSNAETGTLVADRHPDSDLEIPSQIGRYEVIRLLGTGAMGAVYLARDQQLHRQVALKVSKLDNDTERTARIERFQREARAAAALHQPNICPVYDIGEVDGLHFITMAYIDGRTLREVSRSRAEYPQCEAVILARKLALALQCAHEANVVHRDLKPANIMLDKRSEPIIMDFGLALLTDRDEDARITQSGTIIGSPAYMSPEQVSGKSDAIGPACDIYSLGVILYELLARRLPFEGSVMAVIGQIRTDNPPSLRSLRLNIDIELAGIVERMMARSIEDRYSSMLAVVDDLDHWLKTHELDVMDVDKAASRVDGSLGHTQTTGATPFRQTVAPSERQLPVTRMSNRLLSGVAVIVTAICVLTSLWATGIIFKVETKGGVILVEIEGAGKPVEVNVTEDLTLTIKDPIDGNNIQVTVDPERKQLRFDKPGFQIAVEHFSLESSDGRHVTVSFIPRQPHVVEGDTISPPAIEASRANATMEESNTPTSAKSITDIIDRFEAEPSIRDDYSPDAIFVDNETTLFATEQGRLVFARKQPNKGSWGGWWAYPRFNYEHEGLLDVDLRAVGDQGGWIVDLNHKQTSNGKNTYDGLRIVYHNHQISVGGSIFDPRRHESDKQLERVLSDDLPLRSGDEFNSLQLFIQERSVHVYWNGELLGDPVQLPYEIDSATVLLGGVGSPEFPTRAEFQRLEFRRLKPLR